MRLLIVLIVALSTLVSPALADELTTSDGRPVHNVAVISRLSDTITLYYAQPSIPVTVWEGHPRDFTIPNFAIDARIEKAIAAALTPRFTFVALGDSLASTDAAGWEERTVRAKIASLPPRADIDAYIVICPEEESVEMGAFLETKGLVLYRRWKLFGNVTATLGFYRLMIVDARTGETIAGREGGIETSIFQTSLPRRDIDDSFWPGEDAVPAESDIPRLRDKFYEFVDESIAWTLKKMNLTP